MMSLRRTGKLAVGILAGGITLAAAATASAFDFATGNAPIEVVIPNAVPAIFASVGGGDASLILRYTSMITNGWFDAIAPYEPTTVGVNSYLGRRPASESATNENKNVAIMYASLRTMNSVFPTHKAEWTAMMTSVGLDPNDTSTDITTAVGIGNSAGNAVVAFREHDGDNQLGDEGGCLYHCRPYADYLGFEPVNTAYDVIDPSKWQPNIESRGTGLFKVQQMVTPQWSVTVPYSYLSPDAFHVPAPVNSQWNGKMHGNHTGLAGYKAQADQVLAVQANLTDNQKMVAELINNKIRSLGFSALFVAISHGYNLDEFVHYDFLTNIAAFDGGIAVWQEKIHYNAVRPFTAIHLLYGDTTVSGWGGPGLGTVTEPGSEWRAYLDVADHPEYPSGSACFCSAHAQASRRFTGSDAFGWSVPAPAGSSEVEPGVTPATDIVLGPWATFTEFELDCGAARNWAGVHFLDSITASQAMCKPIGDLAYDFVQAHIDGSF